MLIKWLIRAELSSNGSCLDRRAPRSSTLVSHKMGPCGSPHTQPSTRIPLRLRGCLLLVAFVQHDRSMDEHTTTASGPLWSLEQLLVLCLFSSMEERSWLRHPFTRDTLLPQVARSAWSGYPGPPSRRGRHVLCLGRCGDSTAPRLRFDLTLVFRAPGEDAPGGLRTWSPKDS